MNNQNNAYKEKFEPKAVLVGNIILPLSQLIFFVPFLALWFVYDVQPDSVSYAHLTLPTILRV